MSSKKKCCMWSGTRACVCESVARVAKRKQAAAWGEAHRREAHRRNFELAAEFVGTDSDAPARGAPQRGQILLADGISSRSWPSTITERAWCMSLASTWFDAARINAEVRRVRALAEGRLVRETAWGTRVDGPLGSQTRTVAHPQAKEAASQAAKEEPGVVAVRVTRIRRAVPS